jgi:hypothetical protein
MLTVPFFHRALDKINPTPRTEPDLASLALVDDISQSIQLLDLHMRMAVVSGCEAFVGWTAWRAYFPYPAPATTSSISTSGGPLQKQRRFKSLDGSEQAHHQAN